MGGLLWNRPRLLTGRLRDWGLKSLAFLPPLVLLGIASGNWTREQNALHTEYGTLAEKAQNFLSTGLFYGPEIVAVALVVILYAVLLIGWRAKVLFWDKRIALPLVAVVILVVLAPRAALRKRRPLAASDPTRP